MSKKYNSSRYTLQEVLRSTSTYKYIVVEFLLIIQSLKYKYQILERDLIGFRSKTQELQRINNIVLESKNHSLRKFLSASDSYLVLFRNLKKRSFSGLIELWSHSGILTVYGTFRVRTSLCLTNKNIHVVLSTYKILHESAATGNNCHCVSG